MTFKYSGDSFGRSFRAGKKIAKTGSRTGGRGFDTRKGQKSPFFSFGASGAEVFGISSDISERKKKPPSIRQDESDDRTRLSLSGSAFHFSIALPLASLFLFFFFCTRASEKKERKHTVWVQTRPPRPHSGRFCHDNQVGPGELSQGPRGRHYRGGI